MWVASRVASVKVVQHAVRGGLVVVGGYTRAAKRHRGGGEAAVNKARVHLGKRGTGGEEGTERVEADGCAGGGDAIPRGDHGRLEGKGARGANLG